MSFFNLESSIPENFSLLRDENSIAAITDLFAQRVQYNVNKTPKGVFSMNFGPNLLPEKGSIHPYWAYRNIGMDGDIENAHQIIIRINGKRMKLMDVLGKNILRVLQQSDFIGLDCIRFAMKVTRKNNIKQEDLQEISTNESEVGKLFPGQILCFINKEGSISHLGNNGLKFHFTIYLGNGLFLFKLGSYSNEVFISNFENLKRGFLHDYPRIFTLVS